LTAPTVDLLRAHRARSAERMLALGHALSDDDLVFCDDAGLPLWGRHVTTRQLKPLLRDAGLPPIRFHDLRHTFATLQLAAGTNPKIVSEVLGHKEVAITLDRYKPRTAHPAGAGHGAARHRAGPRAATPLSARRGRRRRVRAG
jgi:integrase